VTNPLAEMLRDLPGAQKIIAVREVMKSASDVQVVAYATDADLIVVTTETAMNEKQFKICTHPGIIVLCGRNRHERALANSFKKFMLSGHRKKASHAVVYVSENQARIVTKSTEDEVIQF
jgi:predicted nuclease of predicted toxin-antitoxin system